MSNSLAAIAQGDDYQAMVFWKYANNMLRTDSDVESIGYEYDEVKSFDDVVVIYKRPQSFRTSVVEKDYIQVKYVNNTYMTVYAKNNDYLILIKVCFIILLF